MLQARAEVLHKVARGSPSLIDLDRKGATFQTEWWVSVRRTLTAGCAVSARVQGFSYAGMIRRMYMVNFSLCRLGDDQKGGEYGASPQGCMFPLLGEPFETRRVRVDRSGIPGAGEGLWALDAFEEGDAVCFYSGIR